MTTVSSKTVLIVDDDEATSFLFKLAVELLGFEVLLAHNGEEAFQRLATGNLPGVILLDLMMPVMDGWEFLRQLGHHPQWQAIPVVACTAFNVEEGTLNVKEVLAKPVELQVLIQTVLRWLPAGTSQGVLNAD